MPAPTRTMMRADPNVTPMIDIMLVLLIIFMIVTPALVTGLPAVPPEAVHLRAHPEEPGDQTLGIDATGQYYLNAKPIPNAALAERLRALFAATTGDKLLFIRADKDLAYANVRAALDVAAESGVRVVGLISAPPMRSESTAGAGTPTP